MKQRLVEVPVLGGLIAIDQISSVRQRKQDYLREVKPGMVICLLDQTFISIDMETDQEAKSTLDVFTKIILDIQRCEQ